MTILIFLIVLALAFYGPTIATACMQRARYSIRSHFGYTSKIRGHVITKTETELRK